MQNEKQIRRVIKNSSQEATVEIEMTNIKKSKIIADNNLLDFITGNKIININSLHRTRALSTDNLKSSSSETSYVEQTTSDKKELSQQDKMLKFMRRVEKKYSGKTL